MIGNLTARGEKKRLNLSAHKSASNLFLSLSYKLTYFKAFWTSSASPGLAGNGGHHQAHMHRENVTAALGGNSHTKELSEMNPMRRGFLFSKKEINTQHSPKWVRFAQPKHWCGAWGGMLCICVYAGKCGCSRGMSLQSLHQKKHLWTCILPCPGFGIQRIRTSRGNHNSNPIPSQTFAHPAPNPIINTCVTGVFSL